MNVIAVKNLLHDKRRLLVGITAIAFAVLLILVLEGFSAGLFQQATAFIEHSGADLIVSQAGVDNMQASRSVVPTAVIDGLYQVRGIERISGIVAAPLMFEHEGHKTPVMLIGYRRDQRLGAPWDLAAGRRPARSGEVVFDYALALTKGLKLGDRPKLQDRQFEIVGFSRGTQSFMNPYVFMDRSDAADLLKTGPTASYYLVKTERPSFAPHVKTELEATTKTIDVSTRAQMAANDRTVLEDVMSDPINLMVTIAYLIGFLVIGLTVYTAVVEKSPEFGTIKALGAGNLQLYSIVWRQSVYAVILGFAVGSLLAFAAAAAIEALIPRFEIAVNPEVLIRTFAGAMLMSLAAAFLPARLVARTEPAEVFD